MGVSNIGVSQMDGENNGKLLLKLDDLGVQYPYFWKHPPWKSKDQTLPIGSRESFTWIILKTILCLVLDFQGPHYLKSLRTLRIIGPNGGV